MTANRHALDPVGTDGPTDTGLAPDRRDGASLATTAIRIAGTVGTSDFQERINTEAANPTSREKFSHGKGVPVVTPAQVRQSQGIGGTGERRQVCHGVCHDAN